MTTTTEPRSTCATCQRPIGWVDCPTGGWWRHDQHPADEHDADAQASACAACRHPFNGNDTRWNGRGQYGDAPWCRACIDRCHDNESADHRCPVCS